MTITHDEAMTRARSDVWFRFGILAKNQAVKNQDECDAALERLIRLAEAGGANEMAEMTLPVGDQDRVRAQKQLEAAIAAVEAGS